MTTKEQIVEQLGKNGEMSLDQLYKAIEKPQAVIRSVLNATVKKNGGIVRSGRGKYSLGTAPAVEAGAEQAEQPKPKKRSKKEAAAATTEEVQDSE